MNSSTNPFFRGRTPFEKRAVAAIEAAKPFRGVGFAETPLPGGRSLMSTGRKSAAGSAFAPSWYPMRIDPTHIIIVPGTFNNDEAGDVAYDGGGGAVELFNYPEIEVDDEDENHVYLHVGVTPTIYSDWVTSGVFATPQIEVFPSTSLPTSDNSNRYLRLFIWQSSRLVAQFIKYNIWMACEDNGSRASTPVFRTWAAP